GSLLTCAVKREKCLYSCTLACICAVMMGCVVALHTSHHTCVSALVCCCAAVVMAQQCVGDMDYDQDDLVDFLDKKNRYGRWQVCCDASFAYCYAPMLAL